MPDAQLSISNSTLGGDAIGRDKITTSSGGQRSVAISGDATHSPIVTGDNATVIINSHPQLELAGSRLPARNAMFVGRADTLAQLAQALDADGALAVVTGCGGQGKTQTAIEFGHRYAAQYPGGVFFLSV